MQNALVELVEELRGFRRVTLNPGETRKLSFVLRPDDLAMYDRTMRRVVEPGTFTIMVGPNSSTDKLLTAKLEVIAR